MKMFSDCSGECCVCFCAGDCIAGHNDDFFILASKNEIISRLNKGRFKRYTDYMKQILKDIYDYDYDKEGGKILKDESNKPDRLCCDCILKVKQ